MSALNFLRKQKRQQHVSLTFSDDEDEGKELSVPDPEPLPEERVIFNEKQEAIRAAMNARQSISVRFWNFAWCSSCRMSRLRRSWIFQSGQSSRGWRRARLQLKKDWTPGTFLKPVRLNIRNKQEVGEP